MTHSSKGPSQHFPMSKAEAMKTHLYEFDFNGTRCLFLIDGVVVATITPDLMDDGCIWKNDAKFEALFSVEKHGGWAGHTYSSTTEGQMTIWGIKMPN